MSPRNSCPILAVSAHPALSLASPHTSHLLQPVGSPPSLQTLTHMESQPLPSPGKGLSRGNREGAMTQLPHNLAGLCTPPKPLSVPLPSLKRASSLGLFPIVWVRMWSLYLMPRLAATRPYSRKSCHQAQPSSAYSCTLEKGSPRTCQLQILALHTSLVR